MATTTFRNKNKVRPKKTGSQKRQRIKVQRRRLVSLGVPEETVEHMTTKEVRTLLKRPEKVKKQYQVEES